MINIHKYFLWLYYNKGKKGLFVIGSGLFFWVFLSVTLPFGINNTNLSYFTLPIFLLPAGVCWILIVYAVDFISRDLLKVETDKSSNPDIILWFIKLAGIVHVVYLFRGYFCDWLCLDIYEYLQLWLAFTLMFSFCYLLYAFYAKYTFYQNMVIEGNNQNFDIRLEGDGKEKLDININSLAYLQADDNYVDLFLVDDLGSPKKVALRATLNSLDEQFKGFSEFVRIHRSYIINTKFYNTYSKGNSSITMLLGDENVELPVSRKYKAQVSSLFTHPK